MNHGETGTAPPRIEYLKVANFRALRDVELKNLTPMTVLLGPNGSGKSTVFDVFAFLAECFEAGLRRAWDRRGKAKELKTRGAQQTVTIEIKYREAPGTPLITYHLAVDEVHGAPLVAHEWLRWKRRRPRSSLHFSRIPERPRRSRERRSARRGGSAGQDPAQVSRSPRRQRIGAVPGASAGRRLARLHHGLACIALVCPKRPRPTGGRSPRTTDPDRRQSGQRHPVPERTPPGASAAHFRYSAPACAAHRACGGRHHAGWPVAAANQGRPVREPGAGPVRLRRYPQDAGLPGAALRPRTTALHRNRGTGELPAPAATAPCR